MPRAALRRAYRNQGTQLGLRFSEPSCPPLRMPFCLSADGFARELTAFLPPHRGGDEEYPWPNWLGYRAAQSFAHLAICSGVLLFFEFADSFELVTLAALSVILKGSV